MPKGPSFGFKNFDEKKWEVFWKKGIMIDN